MKLKVFKKRKTSCSKAWTCNKETKELSWVELHLKLQPRERESCSEWDGGFLMSRCGSEGFYWWLVSLWTFSALCYLWVSRNFWQMWKRKLFHYGSATWRWRGVEKRSKEAGKSPHLLDKERFPRHHCWHWAYLQFLQIIWKGFIVKYLNVQSTLKLWCRKMPSR